MAEEQRRHEEEGEDTSWEAYNQIDLEIQDALESERREALVAVIYPVVDAALWNFFEQLQEISEQGLKYRRYMLTAGSARYVMSSTSTQLASDIGAITVQMVTPTHTLLELTRGSVELANARQVTEFMFAIFVRWIEHEQHQIRRMIAGNVPHPDEPNFLSIAKQDILSQLRLLGTPVRRRSRRESWSEDDWAWEQVNIHQRDRTEVRAEWLNRQTSGRVLKNYESSFRYAINPNRKSTVSEG